MVLLFIFGAVIFSIILVSLCVHFCKDKSDRYNNRTSYSNHRNTRPQTAKVNQLEIKKDAEYFLEYNKKPYFRFSREDGFEFENFIKKLFEKLGFTHISSTGQNEKGEGNLNDHGIDLIFELNGIPHIIQCKCHSNELSEDVLKKCYKSKKFAESRLNCKAKCLLVTNNYLEYSDNGLGNCIYVIDLDSLKKLYDFSLFVEDMFYDEVLKNVDNTKLAYCKVGDELNLTIHKKSIVAFNNSLIKRGAENNLLYKITDDFVPAITTLYKDIDISLSGKITEIRDDGTCIIRIKLATQNKTVQDYHNLLEEINSKIPA